MTDASEPVRPAANAPGPGPEYADFRLETGFQYPRPSIAVDAAEQRRLHGWCDIPPTVFGACADPALVSRLPIVMLSNTVVVQRPLWGQVHVVQGLVQHRPIALDERLALEGRITTFAPHARGETMTSEWLYRDAAGAVVFEVHPQVLLIAPGVAPRRDGAPAAAQDASGYRTVLRKTCTPAATVGYCEGTYNPIHFDPAVARDFGFRAPIIAGTQTMSFLLEAVWRTRVPHAFEAIIRLRRPVFWDDVIDVELRAEGSARWQLRACNAELRCVAECDFSAGVGDTP